MEIQNKVALITGAASGIGLATVKELLKNEAKGVIMVDINEKQGAIQEDALRKKYGDERVFYIKADVTKKDEFEDAFKIAIDKYKHLDIVINDAGILNDVNYQKTIDVNLGGTTRGTFLGLKYMGKDTLGSGGIIINVASVAAICKKHYYTTPIYSATKAGIVTLSRGLGHEFHVKKTGVKIMVVCPAGTATSFLYNLQFLNGCLAECSRINTGTKMQKVERLAHSIIHVIKEGSSGSVWLVRDNNLYTIKDYDILENCKELVIENI